MEKPRGPVGGLPAKGSLKGVLVTTPRAQVVRVPTSAVHLSELLERFRWYKYDVMQLLLKVKAQTAINFLIVDHVKGSSSIPLFLSFQTHFVKKLTDLVSTMTCNFVCANVLFCFGEIIRQTIKLFFMGSSQDLVRKKLYVI